MVSPWAAFGPDPRPRGDDGRTICQNREELLARFRWNEKEQRAESERLKSKDFDASYLALSRAVVLRACIEEIEKMPRSAWGDGA